MNKHLPLKAAAFLALAVLAIAAIACGDDDDGGEPAGGVREIEVTLSDDLTFSPDEIELAAGEPVRLVMVNRGATLHDFSVHEIPVHGTGSEGGAEHGHAADDFALHVAVEAGETAHLEFTPTEPGTYAFICSVTGHEAAGMHGVINVN